MIDLAKLTIPEQKAMKDELNRTFDGSRKVNDVLNGIGQARIATGTGVTVYPGWAGIGHARYLPPGEQIRPRHLELYKQNIEFIPLSNSFDFTAKQLKQTQPFTDVKSEVNGLMADNWGKTLYYAMIEYITNNPGQWNILDSDYSTNGFDGLPLYDNSHFPDADGTAQLDNSITQTGIDAPSIEKDFWTAIAQLDEGKIPGTDFYYWEGVDDYDLDVYILYPTNLNEVMKKVFTADMFPAFIAGSSYNSPITNIIAKNARPVLIKSAALKSISSTAWYIFLTSRSASTSPMAIQFFFSPDPIEAGKVGTEFKGEIKFTSKSIVEYHYLGKNSEYYVQNNGKVLLASSTWLGIHGTNPYRTAKIS